MEESGGLRDVGAGIVAGAVDGGDGGKEKRELGVGGDMQRKLRMKFATLRLCCLGGDSASGARTTAHNRTEQASGAVTDYS